MVSGRCRFLICNMQNSFLSIFADSEDSEFYLHKNFDIGIINITYTVNHEYYSPRYRNSETMISVNAGFSDIETRVHTVFNCPSFTGFSPRYRNSETMISVNTGFSDIKTRVYTVFNCPRFTNFSPRYRNSETMISVNTRFSDIKTLVYTVFNCPSFTKFFPRYKVSETMISVNNIKSANSRI